MRKIIQLLICIFIWIALWNEGYSQGGLLHFRDHFKDAEGNIRKGEEIAIELRILDCFGEIVLKERHVILTNEEGLGICWLGKGTTPAGQLEGITWERGGYSLEVIQIDKQIKKVWSVDGVVFSQYPIHTPTLRKKQGTVDYGDDRGILYWGRQQGRLLGISAEGVVLSIVDEGLGKWKPNRVPSISGMTKAVYLGQGEIKMESYGISEELKVRKGFVWDTVSNVGLPGLGRWEEEKEIGSYEARIKGFEPDKMYFIRSYISTSEGTSYGPETMIKTFKALPVLETLLQDTNIITGVGLGGKIVSDGGMALRDRGVVWSTSPNPTIDLPTRMTMTPENMETRDYTSTVKDLQPNTTYYVRAYATNSAGTGYGNEVLFTTSSILLANLPVLTTTVPGSITTSTANSGGVISSDGGAPITARGVVWSTTPKPAITLTTKTMDKTGSGTFSSVMSFLSSNTKYYVRAYATNSVGMAYGEDREFTTLKVRRQTKPVVSTFIPSEVTATTARSGGKVIVDGGSSVTARGVVWSTKRSPTISLETKTVDGPGLGDFISNLPNLASNTKYYVRAYATNANGTAYGLETNFTTLSVEPVPAGPCPEVASVLDVDGNKYNTVQIGKQCWLKENLRVTRYRDGSVLPIDETGGTIGNAAGQTWGGRTTGTRAVYYNNMANVGLYGYLYNWYAASDSKGLCPQGWRVSTDADWTALTDYLGGEFVAGSKMKSTGTTQWQSTNSLIMNESGFTALPGGYRYNDGRFYSIRTDAFFWTSTTFTENNAWYRYITDLKGKVYKNNRFVKSVGASVRCIKEVSTSSIPILTTALVQTVTSTTAVGGGNITSDGVSAVTARGVVWSTSPNPTISLSTKTVDSTGTGVFTSNLSGLTPNTTYYVKAYATNSAGTGYGEERTFKTTISQIITIPSVTTTTIGSITGFTAIGGGNITSDGGSAVTTRGVVWSVNPVPTTSLTTKTDDGSGTGSFPSSIKGLASNTKYYVRAYAVNSVGTEYGNEVTFTTSGTSGSSGTTQGVPCPGAATVKDIDGNTYNTVQIGTQCWTKENLRVTKYSDGTSIPLDNSGGTTGNRSGNTWVNLCIPTCDGSGARTIYAHSQTNLATYGYLYNWYAAKGIATAGSTSYKNLCPTGWHVPTDGDWQTLVFQFVGSENQGGQMKSTTGWDAPNIGATNESGFTGLPGGLRSRFGEFIYLGGAGVWWSSSGGLNAWNLDLSSSSSRVGANYRFTHRENGFSVRCLKDNGITPSTSIPTVTTTDISGITTSTASGGGNITLDGGSAVTSRGVVWSVNPAPTTSLTTKTDDGSGTGSFPSSIKGLASNTKYYVRAYAVNSVGTAYGNEVSFTTSGTTGSSGTTQGVPCPGASSVKDIDGNTYNTVQIGTQCWTKENLRVTKYSDGTSIPLDNSGGTEGIASDESWSKWVTGARTIYAHSEMNLATYGYLYNWYAARGIATTGGTSYKNICPTGWHVPSEGEWSTLTTQLGERGIAGGKMKSTIGWNAPNTGATNESGFTGLPGGIRDNSGEFGSLGSVGVWWSSSERDSKNAGSLDLIFNSGFVNRYYGSIKGDGLSVRCLRDNVITPSTSIPTVTTTDISGITTSTANGGGNITSDGGSSVTSRGVVWSVNPVPTTSLTTKTDDGSGTGSFPSSIKGLASNTKYYVRAYAVNSVGTAYGNEVTFTTSGTTGCSGATQGVPCPGASTVKDIDGNTYNTVQIGTQCWTKENLRVTKYSDGTSIPLDNSGGTEGIASDESWSKWVTGARTIYAHSQTNLATYGYLYNWYAAKGTATAGSTSYKNLCPTGWHVPSKDEWDKLVSHLGGAEVAGGKMKCTTGWNAPNKGATNESGFTGLPGGTRDYRGAFNFLGFASAWWSSSEYFSINAWYLALDNLDGGVLRGNTNKGDGLSVRCLRDL
jgi:uncharacterized protein (TIGR02145 family)